MLNVPVTERMMFGGLIRILLVSLQLSIGVCELLCPAVPELNTTSELTCFTQGNSLPSHSYTRPNSGTAAVCSTIGRPCIILNENYNARFFNVTHSLLTIYRVTLSDAGRWSCTVKDSNPETCDLEVMKTPTCIITSTDDDTNALVQYQELNLAVDVLGYYCSNAYNVSLQTGNVTTLLMEADSVSNVTDNTSLVTLNVTDSHLGTAGLLFTCNKNQRDLKCDGVNNLAPRTATCNITSDKVTETLTLHEEVTLTVDLTAYYDIRGSYCSIQSNFTLQTGAVRHLLHVGDEGLQPITINVTETHLGDVRLVFNCQVQHLNLTCDGVTQLNNKTNPHHDEVATASTPIIIAGVLAGALIVIVVVIIIVLVVKRKVNRIKPRTSVKPCSPPYKTVGEPGSTAYATVEVNDSTLPVSGQSGPQKVVVIDAGGYACAGDIVPNAENTTHSPPRDESVELSETSADRPKIGVIVQKIVPQDDQTCVNELYASVKKPNVPAPETDTTAV